MSGLLDMLPGRPERKGWPWDEQTDPKLYNMQTHWPKISIVTPSFNQGCFIEETIRSILLQNYPNLEYLIIDGGSTDETTDIIKKYADHINYWESEKDKGQSDAINKGLKICKGDYFNWINSDDYLERNALFNLARQIDQSTDLIAGFCTIFIEETDEIELSYQLAVAESPEATIVEHAMCQPAMFYKTEILKEFGGVDDSLHYVMDLALFMQYVSESGTEKIALIPEPVAYFRKHGLSKTESSQEKFEQEERLLYSYLLSLSTVCRQKISLISNEVYLPKKPWSLKLNHQFLEKLIYRRFFFKKARQAYAQSNYPLMKEYTNRYLKTRAVEWNMTTLKLAIFSNLISAPLLQTLRKFYKSLSGKDSQVPTPQ